MELPIQVRLEGKAKKKLSKAGTNTGIHQVDLIRLAVDELFEKYPSDKLLIEAMIRRRVARSGKAKDAA